MSPKLFPAVLRNSLVAEVTLGHNSETLYPRSLTEVSCVFLQQPEPTSADLQFYLFGTHVRVHPLFWLMSAIFGWDFLSLGFQYLLIWMVCVFVSILLHEFGHVFMGRLLGSEGHIVLHSFGGLAIGSNNFANPWKRIAVSLAGPFAQFGLYGLLLLVPTGSKLQLDYPSMAMWCLREINFFWPLLNLLPVFPLDGGQVVRDFLSVFVPSRAVRASLTISATVAGAIALNSLSAYYKGPHIPWVYTGGLYTAIFFGMMTVANVQALNQDMERQRWVDDHRVYYDDDRGGWR